MIPRPSSFNIKCKKLINYYPKSSKFSNSAMSGFYSTKNFFQIELIILLLLIIIIYLVQSLKHQK